MMRWGLYLIAGAVFLLFHFRNFSARGERILGGILIIFGMLCLFLYESGILGVGIPSLIMFILGKVGFLL